MFKRIVGLTLGLVLAVSITATAEASPDVIVKGGYTSRSTALDGDLVMTKDKKIVISHNTRLPKCGNKLISKMKWKKIRKCDRSVMRLETFLNVAKRHGKAVSIEPKGNWSKKKLKKLHKVVKGKGMLSRTQFWSFHPSTITRWRSLDKYHQTKTGLNVRVSTPQNISALKRLGGRVAINYYQTNGDEVKRLRSGGIYVVIYTVFDQKSLDTVRSWNPNAYYSLF